MLTKTNKFNIKKYNISYPFGENLNINIDSVQNMAKDFMGIAATQLKNNKNLVLICMGSSGAIVSTVFYNLIHKKYRHLNITISHVKKENEDCHGDRISGLTTDDFTLYVWVDDFIESGSTVVSCYNAIREYFDIKKIYFEDEFRYDYLVCSTIMPGKCNIKELDYLTKNIIYNYL